MADDEYEAYVANPPAEPSVESIVYRQTMGKWFGPVFRSRISYKFKNRITVDAKMNLFYGFAVGGPDSDYEKIKKFNGTWGASVSSNLLGPLSNLDFFLDLLDHDRIFDHFLTCF